jgi:hypothetical protein
MIAFLDAEMTSLLEPQLVSLGRTRSTINNSSIIKDHK